MSPTPPPRRSRSAAPVFLLVLLAACADKPVDRQAISLRRVEAGPAIRKSVPADAYAFGFDSRLEPAEDARIYAPFLRYLERTTGYRFAIRFPGAGKTVPECLGSGELQFAAVGPVTFLLAQEGYGAVLLARGRDPDGKTEYRAAIVTRPDSPVRSVADLRGKRFVFGEIGSARGYLIPRMILEESGIRLQDLSEFTFTGSHELTARAVLSGRWDAGGIHALLAHSLEASGDLRVVHWSAFFPGGGIAASPGVPEPVRESVRKALLAFDPGGRDREGLYRWDLTEMAGGFAPVGGDEYRLIRSALKRYYLLPGRIGRTRTR